MSNNSTTEKLPEGFIYEDNLPLKVSLLRWKLGNKAKQEPDFKFYALYDRIYRWDVLHAAYEKVRANDGSPGYDRISFVDIETAPGGRTEFLLQLQKSLKEKTYSPKPVKRVYIPKANGKMRPLGIPCIVDRVAQQAVLLIIEPIFEADFLDCSYGFRPGKSAHQALNEIKGHLHAGKEEIYDADLSSYFDTIDHELLMEMVEKRITDRSVLHLIRMWLKCNIVEEDKDKRGQTRIIKPKEGTPQGGVISPLLANIFLNNFDKAFHSEPDSPHKYAKAKLIRYADDFVIMARYVTERIVRWIEDKIENALKLTINKEKTTIVNLNKTGGQLNFLGYTFRKDRDLNGRPWRYLNMFPSNKAVDKLKENLRDELKKGNREPFPRVIEKINQKTRGWKEYFKLGYPKQSYRDINYFLQGLLKGFLKNRSQRKQRIRRNGESHYSAFKRGGLVYL